jgi:hypothetical protein
MRFLMEHLLRNVARSWVHSAQQCFLIQSDIGMNTVLNSKERRTRFHLPLTLSSVVLLCHDCSASQFANLRESFMHSCVRFSGDAGPTEQGLFRNGSAA